MDYTVHGILQARILEWVVFTFSRRSSQTRDQTRSPTLQMDSLPAEPQGKPKNTGVSSLSIPSPVDLPDPKLNRGLLHCRRTLYQLSYKECEKVTTLKHLYYHMWNRPPVQVRCMKWGTQSQCTGTTLRDRVGREVGGREEGSGWGTQVHPCLFHVNVWQKPLHYCKIISLQWKWIN